MERNTLQEMRQIIDAIEQGKDVQFQDVNTLDKDKWCSYVSTTPNFFSFRYRIKPEEPTKEETLLTNRELTKWLAQGNGEYRIGSGLVCIFYTYSEGTEDDAVKEFIKIRRFDEDNNWHKPTREYAFGEDA